MSSRSEAPLEPRAVPWSSKGPPASFDSLRTALRARYEMLSPHLKRLASLALEDPNRLALGTVAELALHADVQPSSVIRFAQSFGYRGFSQMQRIFKVRLIEGAPGHRERILEDRRREGPSLAHERHLRHFVQANIEALDALLGQVAETDLEIAAAMLRAARSVHVIGVRRAFPVAAYLFYGLVRTERRCQLLDGVGGMLTQQVAMMTAQDLLVAVSFAEYAPITVETVKDVHIRGIPTLTITDARTSPLATHASLAFILDDPGTHALRPLAAAMCLVQTLVAAAGEAG